MATSFPSTDTSHDFILSELLKNHLSVSDATSICETISDIDNDMKTQAPHSFYQGEIPGPSDAISKDKLHSYVLSMLTADKSSSSNLPKAESLVKTSNNSTSKSRQSKKSHNNKPQDFGANMVIHVCDEGKKLNQDFTCPRNLLVKEMKYFAEYLSLDSQRLEEVDISVHCDIHIFDWLMRYVKRATNLIKESEVPQLEANNVVSILISSDFLRMETLVSECVGFCHENMSAILSTPCNMNCINDQLCSRIAKRFTHNQLSEVKDRKDKFKSKLFCKKIEQLFDNAKGADSSTLFKCSRCQQIMTQEQTTRLACSNHSLTISVNGELSYCHQVDVSWDINSWIVSLYEELHQWSMVYWRLWATLNDLTCTTCNCTFQLFEFGHCQYHRDKANFTLFEDSKLSDTVVGIYPCCNQSVLRFDPTETNKGCCVRDHTVSVTNSKERELLDDLVLNSHYVKVDYIPMDSDHTGHVNIFSREELTCCIEDATMTPTNISSKRMIAPNINKKKVKDEPVKKKFSSVIDVGSDEDEDDDNLVKSSFTLTKAMQKPSVQVRSNFIEVLPKSVKKKYKISKDSTTYRKCPSKHRWDSSRPTRYNQDMQREEDRRRMNELSTYLSKQGSSERTTDKMKTNQPAKELQGGMFVRLELAFLNSLKSNSAGATHDKRSLQNNNAQVGRDSRHRYRGR